MSSLDSLLPPSCWRLAAPARAANKDMERLYVQIAALQSQIADLQRASEESLKEIRRLNEVAGRAEREPAEGRRRPARPGRGVAGLRARDFTERSAEMRERMDGLDAAAAAPQVYTPGGGAAGVPAARQPAAAGSTAFAGRPDDGAAPVAGPTLRRRASSTARPTRDYARGNYDLAIQDYQEYLRNYPSTDFADNAQYWIGECLYSKQNFPEAIEAWDELFRAFPSSDKLPDARLKKGMALERLGRRRDALAEYRSWSTAIPTPRRPARPGSACRPDRPIRTAAAAARAKMTPRAGASRARRR